MSSALDLVNKAVAYALAQVGKPYVLTPPGARPPNSWDCSKLTSWAWKEATGGKVILTPYTVAQVGELDKIPGVSPDSLQGLQKGDILFYFGFGVRHCTIYIGGGELVSASNPANGVVKEDVWTNWNKTHFTSAGRVKGLGSLSESENSGNVPNKDDESNQRLIKETRSVGKNAVALSRVYGTTQNARFAAMNLSNETIYLNASGVGGLSGADEGLLQIVANTVTSGDEYELKKLVPGGRNSYEISIDTQVIQSEAQAEAVASMISRSFSYQYKSINVKIFGNPLIQLGDVVKFNFYSGKVISSQNDYYIVTRVSHNFDTGLSTEITIKPLIQTVSVV